MKFAQVSFFSPLPDFCTFTNSSQLTIK